MGVDCLYDFIQDIDNPLLFIDKREHVKYFEKINAQHIRKVFVLHSNHLDFPYTEPSKFSPTVSDLFYSLDNQTIDRLVVLTTGQKEDILLEKNLKNKIEVIPHYQPQILNDIVTKKENLIVSLARYHNAKNLADAIKIVNKVKDVIPTIRYEIYGYGPQKDMLNSLIKNLGLEENVFLKGHTTSPISKLEEAKVSLMTSNYEGFCLTISEALACATPVVSYKTKYGPNELIRNGLDGYLVDLNENKIINAADKLIEILKMNSISYTKMQRNALEITKRFSKDKTASLWENFINKLD
jgi:poly(glycerol-phosphate) alpha-glucosyltransferase